MRVSAQTIAAKAKRRIKLLPIMTKSFSGEMSTENRERKCKNKREKNKKYLLIRYHLSLPINFIKVIKKD